MIAVGHQPNYLPYLGFFAKIAAGDVFVIVDNVQYVKRGPFGWQNRNKIRNHDGWQWLTVPVLTKGKYHQNINEARINNREHWRGKHWRSIEYNYHNAPFFDRYADFFKSVYEREWEMLCNLNITLIRYLLDQLGIDVPVQIASQEEIAGEGTGLIVDICKKTGADTYLHGEHGGDYADFEKIESAGIDNLVQAYKHPTYPQCFEGFESHMSAIDLLFNCGPDSCDILVGGNEIK
ncbi:MAG: WbqC family protein [Planctomycetes bacterium]|nr:WbqC family protein [Planctomycetota bacterium]